MVQSNDRKSALPNRMQHCKSASNSISMRGKQPAVPKLQNLYRQDTDETSLAENKVSSFIGTESADKGSNLRITENSHSFTVHHVQSGVNH